jgi:hypothetical protein
VTESSTDIQTCFVVPFVGNNPDPSSKQTAGDKGNYFRFHGLDCDGALLEIRVSERSDLEIDYHLKTVLVQTVERLGIVR